MENSLEKINREIGAKIRGEYGIMYRMRVGQIPKLKERCKK